MESKHVRYGFVGLGCIFAFYLFSTTPAYFYVFGLGANDTCEDFRKAPMKARIDFLMGCGCLTDELYDKIIQYDLDEKVQDCFYRKVRTCLGFERIGNMYKNCVKSVAP